MEQAGKDVELRPKLESVGFVNDYGIGLSSLHSESFKDGEVIIQLYKANTPENRKTLMDSVNNDKKRNSGIAITLSTLGIPLPKYNETWDIKARTTDGKDIDEIIVSSD